MLVDAYQTLGSLPIDVRALDCDFLVGGVLKYLLGSAGPRVPLLPRASSCEGIEPTATGWFADRDIFEMDIHDYSPAPTARRFEAGTPPVPSIYAAIAGIELMQEIGIAETRGARARAERAPARRPRGARRRAPSRRARRSRAARSSACRRPT